MALSLTRRVPAADRGSPGRPAAQLARDRQRREGLCPDYAPVHHGDKLLRALLYVANHARQGRASARYREAVAAAARQWKLPEGYVRTLERSMISA